MARLISVPGLTSLLLVSHAREIDDLMAHPGLARAFVAEGPLVNRALVAGLNRQFRHEGRVLPAFQPREDEGRVAAQRQLFERLDRLADAGTWPTSPVVAMARYVALGRERKAAETGLAFAVAWPFLGQGSAPPKDDAYKPQGRHLWRLHRRTVRSRRPISLTGLGLRLIGADRRARSAILKLAGGDLYGLHAVEVTLANAHAILENMRRLVAEGPIQGHVTGPALAWAAIRTAPEVVVRQTGGAATTLPHVASRIPPRTLVLLRMRRGLVPDADSGYEFASSQWSACPARRYVMGLFSAVGAAAIDIANAEAKS